MASKRRISIFLRVCLRLNFIIPFVFLLTQDAQAARVVEEKRECATCHIAWMSDFKTKEVTTLVPYNPRPQVATGRQDVVSTETMCFSCHDGYVMDSRFLWKEGGHTHPVGVIPSDKVSIPKDEDKTIFPLNDDGKMYCGTCHSAHGVKWGSKLSPVFLRAENINSSLCMTCHVDRKGQHVNHPLNRKVTNNKQKLDQMGSKFKDTDEVICQSCHKVHGAKEEKLLVEKNEKSQLCEVCHQDKQTTGVAGSGQHFTHPVGVIPKEVTVPSIFSESGSKFGPDREVICQSCHTPHLAPPDNKLLVLDSEHLEQGICVNCHEKQRSLLGTGHNLLSGDSKVVSTSELPSSNLGVCGVCHNIHSGAGPKMWARELKPEGDRVAALCLSCHSKGAPAEKHTVGEYSHPVGKSLSKAIDPGILPLFTPSGEKTPSSKSGRVSCPTCHDVHGPASQIEHAASTPNKQPAGGKYLRKGEGNLLSLCKTCHKDKWSISQTKHDLDIKKGDPLALGICGNCHQVHNGKGPRMWSREDALNVTESGALCKSCHKKGGLAENKTTGSHSHPIAASIEKAGIEVTRQGWVSGKGGEKTTQAAVLPLYDAHGDKTDSKNGTVSCPTCHDPHRWTSIGSDKKSNSRQEDEGDATNSFLRIPAAPDGELCVTCHTAKTPIRATDHDLSVTAPKVQNALGEDLHESGICGQCHAVHNAVQDLALWGRLPGQADNAPEMLCRSCHDAGEIAQAKIPEKASHPAYVMAWDGNLRDLDKQEITHLPVFSDSGRQALTGYITCPTCHNVHQWSPNKNSAGSGKNEEGDVFSSFLRTASSEQILCADCHGLDAIFRYKYFHGASFNKPKEN